MTTHAAIRITGLSHHYAQRRAINDLSLEIHEGEIFTFLGPNGSGKTTLFRVLSTLLPLESGKVEILGYDLMGQTSQIRGVIGVVFQAPSLDKKLTVEENIRYQAALYGMTGRVLQQRKSEMLQQLGLLERANELTETLSGGLRRRVELAKGMIHQPRLLLLDEPSTGLDPGARSDLWKYLRRVCREHGVTIVMTTHLLEEAERSDRIAILDEGSLVALDTPDALRESVGGDSITIKTEDPQELVSAISTQFSCQASIIDGSVRLELPQGHQWIARLVEAFPEQIKAITLGKPTLEDVFIEKTGHRFWNPQEESSGV